MMSETKERKPRTIVTQVTNEDGSITKQFDDGLILIPNVRFSYPHVFVAQEGQSDDGTKTLSFSLTGLAPKNTHLKTIKLLSAVRDAILKEHKIERIPKDKFFVRDGDDAAKEGYDGMYTISSRESKRPLVRDAKGMTLDPARHADVIYGGCYGNMVIRPWWQSNKYGKRVNAGLSMVQFLRDGEAFGNTRITDNDADDILGAGGNAEGFDDAASGDDSGL